MTALHRYSAGIPRVINLLCEHCLVSAFVDQQKVIGAGVVEAVAREFELGDGVVGVPAETNGGMNQFNVVEALRSLALLADRLRHEGPKP